MSNNSNYFASEKNKLQLVSDTFFNAHSTDIVPCQLFPVGGNDFANYGQVTTTLTADRFKLCYFTLAT